jgi:hypothetical protein
MRRLLIRRRVTWIMRYVIFSGRTNAPTAPTSVVQAGSSYRFITVIDEVSLDFRHLAWYIPIYASECQHREHHPKQQSHAIRRPASMRRRRSRAARMPISQQTHLIPRLQRETCRSSPQSFDVMLTDRRTSPKNSQDQPMSRPGNPPIRPRARRQGSHRAVP